MASRINPKDDQGFVLGKRDKVPKTYYEKSVTLPRIIGFYDFINNLLKENGLRSEDFDIYGQIVEMENKGFLVFKKQESANKEADKIIVNVEHSMVEQMAAKIGFYLSDYLPLLI